MAKRDRDQRGRPVPSPAPPSTQSRHIEVAELLRGLSKVEAEMVLELMRDRTYATAATVFSIGDRQQGLYVVRGGLVEEFRSTESGNKLPINRIGPGKVFGLSSVQGYYCCTAEAVADSVIGFLPFSTLEDVCRRCPRLAVNMVEVLAGRLGEIEERLEVLAFSGLRSRVAWALLGLSATHGPTLKGVTHEALAEWAASSRPKVSIVLEEMEQAGLLRLARGAIDILDRVSLEQLAKQASVS